MVSDLTVLKKECDLMAEKKLYRSTSDTMLAGVCGGLAEYLDLDPSIVRIVFALLTLCTGIGAPLYGIMWIVIPEAPGVADVSTAGVG
jgi:phage shock protein C